jgi:hypothetical protein
LLRQAEQVYLSLPETPRHAPVRAPFEEPPQEAGEPLYTKPARELPRNHARPPPEPKGAGKGGSQHRYVQHLIKELAEERGLRAVIEEAVPGGQVDVGLHRGELSVACEISVTSTPQYEARNLAKCIQAGFVRIWAISPDSKRRKAIVQSAQTRLSPDEFAKIEFLTTDELVTTLDSLAVPVPEEKVVAGYRVTSTRKAISPAEAKERRSAIARILADSMRKSEQ